MEIGLQEPADPYLQERPARFQKEENRPSIWSKMMMMT